MLTLITINLILICLATYFAIKYLSLKSKTITIYDNKPKTDSNQAKAMKLSNELGKYIKEDGDIIYLTVVK